MQESARGEEEHSSPTVAADPAELRAAPRHTLLIRTAKLIVAGAEYLCVLRDVSETGVSLRLFHDLATERFMMLELQNEDRQEVELVWHDGERMGLRFVERVDVNRLIEIPSQRRPIRVRLCVPAVLSAGEENAICSIRDLSQHGANVACGRTFAIDQRVRLVTAGMPMIQARVRWRSKEGLGLVFETTFQLAEFAGIVAGFHGNDPGIPKARKANPVSATK